jgi:hypothetical protein
MTRASMKLATAVALLFAASIVPATALDATVTGGNGSLRASETRGPLGTNANLTLGGGRTASATVNSGVNGGTGARATIGGGSSVAKATVGSGGNTATVSIGGGSGPLLSAGSTGNPLAGTSATLAAVNLGGLTGGLGTVLPTSPGSVPGAPGGGVVSGGAGGGGGVIHTPSGKRITTARVERVADQLSTEERRKLKLRCASILMSPAAFDDSLVGLCRILRGL